MVRRSRWICWRAPLDHPGHFQRKEGTAVRLSTRCIEPHELFVRLAEIEFDRPQMMGALTLFKFSRRFAMSVRHQDTRSDVVHVIRESPAVTDIQVLVVVLGDQPVTGTLTSVVLGVPRPDLDRQILPGGFQHERDESTVAGRSVVGNAEVSPDVQVVLDPISPLAQLPGGKRHPVRSRRFARGSRLPPAQVPRWQGIG